MRKFLAFAGYLALAALFLTVAFMPQAVFFLVIEKELSVFESASCIVVSGLAFTEIMVFGIKTAQRI